MQLTERHPHEDHLPEGFHMTELGPLPTEWRVVRLGEAASLERGLSWSKSDERAEGIGVVKIPDILDSGKINFSPQVHLSKKIGEKKLLEKDDILLVGSSGAVKNVGRAAILEVEPIYPLTFASFTVRLRTRPKIMIPQFAFYLVQSQWVDFSVFSKRAADGKYNLQLRQLGGACIPLPPLAEQQAIAQVLRTVQQAQSATDKVIDALHTLKQSLMRHLFTYGAVPVDQASQVPLQETELGAIPAHWQVVRLGEVVQLTKGRKPPKISPKYELGSVPYLTADFFRSREAKQWVPKESASGLPSCSAGDIVLIWDGSKAGEVFIGLEGILASTMVRVCPVRDIMSDYLFYFLSTQFELLNSQTTGTTIPHVNKELFLNLPTPLPPLDEQRAIAQILHAVDAKIATERAYRAALDALFRTLLHQLMTGQIRVTSAMQASDAAPIDECRTVDSAG